MIVFDEPEGPLTEEELDETFGPAARIEDLFGDDELEDFTSLEPPPAMGAAPPAQSGESAEGGETHRLYRTLRLFVIVVSVLLGVQTLQIVMTDRAPIETGDGVEASPAAPIQPAFQEILENSRLALDRGHYFDLIEFLEPFTRNPSTLSADQRLQLYVLLSVAYRRIGSSEKAQTYATLATDQTVGHRSPTDLITWAEVMRSRGRYADSRRIYHSILSRADGLGPGQKTQLQTAEIRLADLLTEQAWSLGTLPPLPGADPMPRRKGEEP